MWIKFNSNWWEMGSWIDILLLYVHVYAIMNGFVLAFFLKKMISTISIWNIVLWGKYKRDLTDCVRCFQIYHNFLSDHWPSLWSQLPPTCRQNMAGCLLGFPLQSSWAKFLTSVLFGSRPCKMRYSHDRLTKLCRHWTGTSDVLHVLMMAVVCWYTLTWNGWISKKSQYCVYVICIF